MFVPHDGTAAFYRNIHPLVRVNPQAVGALYPGEPLLHLLGQNTNAAIGGIDVKPEILLVAQISDTI